MELTKEYFDKQFESLGEKFVTKEYFEEYLDKKLDEKLEPLIDDIRDVKHEVIDIKEIVARIDKRDLEDSRG
jgi:hypothetical protein